MQIGSKMPRAGSLEENGFQAIFISDDAAYHDTVVIDGTTTESKVAPDRASIAKVFCTEETWITYRLPSVVGVLAPTGKFFVPSDSTVFVGVETGAKLVFTRASARSGTAHISFGGTF